MDELIESSHSNFWKYTMSEDANTEQRQKYNTLMSYLIVKHFKSNFLLIVSLTALKIAGNFCCDLWRACLFRTDWLSSQTSLISDSRWDCWDLFPHHSAPGRAITAHAQDWVSACLLSPGLLIICLTAPSGAPCEPWRLRRGNPPGNFRLLIMFILQTSDFRNHPSCRRTCRDGPSSSYLYHRAGWESGHRELVKKSVEWILNGTKIRKMVAFRMSSWSQTNKFTSANTFCFGPRWITSLRSQYKKQITKSSF